MIRSAARGVWILGACVLLFATVQGCTSVGAVGLLVRRGADPARLVATGKYDDLGPAEASSCRYMIIGVLPLGNADLGYVLEKALRATGGDALINASTSNSLYGFVPIYNVLSMTCTTVRGTSIRFPSTQ